MINSITLYNFKCFEHQEFKLRPLTLLAGLNSSGKSTIIQSLLLLRQSHQGKLLPDVGLALNGSLVQLGTAKDVLFEEAATDEVGFLLREGPEHIDIRFAYDEESDVLATNLCKLTESIWQTSLFRDRFRYLQAERIGPRRSFEMSGHAVRRQDQIGSAGEYAAQYISLFGSNTVTLETVRHPASTSNTLQSQVEAWMGEISPGVRLHFKKYSEIDLVSFRVSYSLGHQVASSEYRSTNVGFGVTYALPVAVAILSARPGDVLVIENPEAHLHPRGQVRIGELLALAAAGGAQILIETHSDHVLNGIRLVVHGHRAKPQDIALYHSRWPSGAKSPELTMLELDADGRLNNWPEGFFDELERSLDRLLGDA